MAEVPLVLIAAQGVLDIAMDAAMVQDTEKLMGGLQMITEKVTSGQINLDDGTGWTRSSKGLRR